MESTQSIQAPIQAKTKISTKMKYLMGGILLGIVLIAAIFALAYEIKPSLFLSQGYKMELEQTCTIANLAINVSNMQRAILTNYVSEQALPAPLMNINCII